MNTWIQLALDAISTAPTIEHGVNALLAALHNEMEHGSGTNAPLAVTAAALDAADEIAYALQENLKKSAAKPPARGSADPAPEPVPVKDPA